MWQYLWLLLMNSSSRYLILAFPQRLYVEEMEILSLGTLRALCPSRIHPGLLCHSPSVEKQDVPSCWIWNTCIVQSVNPSFVGRVVTEWFQHMYVSVQVSDGQSCVSLSNWKAVISKTYLTRWRKGLGFSSTSVTWNMVSVTSVFSWLPEMKVSCSREGGLCLCIFIAVKREIPGKFRVRIKYYCLASAFYISQSFK